MGHEALTARFFLQPNQRADMKIDIVMWGLSLLMIGVVITFFGFLGSAFWSANSSKIMNIDLSAGLDISGGTGMAPVARFVKCYRALDNQLDSLNKMDYSHKRNGKPLLSWRVILLPFMGYEELAKKFNYDEPWDSEHNKKLLVEVPEEFLYLDIKEPGLTRVSIPSGKAMFYNPTGKFTGDGCRDGFKHTVLFYETADPVPWTKPTEPEIDIKSPHKSIFWHNSEVGYVHTGAGAPKRVAMSMSSKDLDAVLTANGGEVVSSDTWYTN